MYLYGAWQIGGNSGTDSFTGTSSVQTDPSNERDVADQDDIYFFGQLINRSTVDCKIKCFLSKSSSIIQDYDLRAGSTLVIKGVPLWRIGIIINGSVTINGIGFLVKSEGDNDLVKILSSCMIEEVISSSSLSGDLEFLKGKADSSDIIIVTGSRSTDGDIVSYTPASGKTFYHVKSQTVTDGASAGVSYYIVSLNNDGTDKDFLVGVEAEPHANSVIFDSLVGDGSKKYSLSLNVVGAAITVYGTIFGWIEDT